MLVETGVALGGREEDQSEAVVDSEPAGDEAPGVEYEGLAIIARCVGQSEALPAVR